MNDKLLTILAISDLHFMGLVRQSPQSPQMYSELAQTLLRKVFLRLKHQNVQPDLVLVLGDLIEESSCANSHLDLHTLHGELLRTGIPFLAIPGNHDGDPTEFCELFDSKPGLHLCNGYGLVLFHDTFINNRDCSRANEDLTLIKKVAAKNPGLPLIAVQHAPIYPPIDSHYPYRPTNAAEILESYQRAGVILSISGHYHKGQKLRSHEEVLYHTVPSLAEHPFRFSVIQISGTQVEVEEHTLALQLPNLIDVHCHTEHAWCATTADTAPIIALSQAMGVSTLCFTEHAFQLYFERKFAMSFKWQDDPTCAQKVWQTPKRGRMAAYRKFAQKLRSDYVKIGLEVDLFDNGRLLLAEEDEEFDWDIIIGSIHCIQDYSPTAYDQKRAEKLFMRDVELLLETNVTVLAHPFRFFPWHKLKVPTHLFDPVATLLADTGVAAEINFHAYQPELEFIQKCVEKGVKLALASDTHDLAEAGEFWPHAKILKEAGITPKMFPEMLFTFKSRSKPPLPTV